MARKNISSGRIWEDKVGYSRAVRQGSHIFVSGTAATNDLSSIIGKGDPYLQTVQCIKNIETALKAAGATLKDVVRTRMYVIDIGQWKEIGRAHAEYFDEIKPATAMVQISRLIDPEMLVEIEADAVLSENE
jgi:enamine deaminase RidA (YjgF/YER057c/UK114 family)